MGNKVCVSDIPTIQTVAVCFFHRAWLASTFSGGFNECSVSSEQVTLLFYNGVTGFVQGDVRSSPGCRRWWLRKQ